MNCHRSTSNDTNDRAENLANSSKEREIKQMKDWIMLSTVEVTMTMATATCARRRESKGMLFRNMNTWPGHRIRAVFCIAK